MVRVVVKNNLIAIAIQICVWPFSFYSLLLLESKGWGDFTWLPIMIMAILAFFLYFWTGKRFLTKTKSVLTDVFSVTVLATILIAPVCIWGAKETGGWITNIPFALLGMFIFDSFYKKENFGVVEAAMVVMAILPSLAMWIGIRSIDEEDY
jgi:hypothetical protein